MGFNLAFKGLKTTDSEKRQKDQKGEPCLKIANARFDKENKYRNKRES
jgi:hypothetical protein